MVAVHPATAAPPSPAGPVEQESTKLVTLATLAWQPYIGPDLPAQGYVATVVREAFAHTGYSVDFTFMPWARVVRTAQQGGVDGYGPEYFDAQRAEEFHFSDPFPGGPLGFFRRSDDPLEYTILPDLAGKRIGVVRGYVNTERFDSATYLNKMEAVDDLANLRTLLAGRIDLFVADKYVGYWLARTHMPDRARELAFVEPWLEMKDLYMCFGRQEGKAEGRGAELTAAFNAGLAHLRATGRLRQIYEAMLVERYTPMVEDAEQP